MCAGLIAGWTFLWKGLLAALVEFVLADAGAFLTRFTVGIAHPFRNIG
jgi:hypothetical protein